MDRAHVKLPKEYRNSLHLNRWSEGESGRERFETKELRNQDVQRTLDDKKIAEQRAEFNTQAQDNTPKSARARFIPSTDETASAKENYRRNFVNIDWSK